MIKNQDGTYIYLTVPEQYKCVYEKLLIKLSDLGIDIVKDCGATCRGINRSVINCWNMFQAACAAYALGEEKKAHLLIHYINTQLQLGCSCNDTNPDKPNPDKPNPDKPNPDDSPNITNFKLNITNCEGSQTLQINTATFTIANATNIKANSLKILTSTGEVIKEGLGITSPQTFDNIPLEVVEGNSYTFYAQIEDNEEKVYKSNNYTITCSERQIVSYNYYGTNEDATIDSITTGQKTTSSNINRLPTPTKVVWFAIPQGKSLVIDNADMNGDYFYNPNQGYNNNRLQEIQTTTIDGITYEFYKFVYFVNIEINLKVTIS